MMIAATFLRYSVRAHAGLAFAALAGMLAGCVTTQQEYDDALAAGDHLVFRGSGMTRIDPPKLDLPPAPLSTVTIANGAGKTLYQGPAPFQARPDPADLDGTLKVRSNWGGEVVEQTLTHRPNQLVTLTANDKREFSVKTTDPEQYRRHFAFDIGPYFVEAPPVGIGTVIRPGGEVFLGQTDDRARGLKVDLSYTRPGWGVGQFSYYSADKSSEAREPVGGSNVAITYHGPAGNGSTGVGAGATGLRAMQDAEVRGLDLSWYFNPLSNRSFHYSQVDDDEDSEGGPRIVLGGRYAAYTGWVQSETFPGVSSTTYQDVDEYYIGAGVFGQRTHFHSPRSLCYWGGFADLRYVSADYSGSQRNRCDLCPAAEQDFTVNTSDDDSFGAVVAGLRVGGLHRFSRNVQLGGNINYEYWSKAAALRNPQNPSERAPHLERQSVRNYGVNVSLKYSF
jgi:hypothetical protein